MGMGGRNMELVRLETHENCGLCPAIGRRGTGCMWVPPEPAEGGR